MPPNVLARLGQQLAVGRPSVAGQLSTDEIGVRRARAVLDPHPDGYRSGGRDCDGPSTLTGGSVLWGLGTWFEFDPAAARLCAGRCHELCAGLDRCGDPVVAVRLDDVVVCPHQCAVGAGAAVGVFAADRIATLARIGSV